MTQTQNKINNTPQQLKQIIDGLNNLLLISHVMPDGDNIGSLIGLSLALTGEGKTVTAVANGEMPAYCRCLKGGEKLLSLEEFKAKGYVPGDFDGIICLDTADYKRGGDILELMGEIPVLINIDHHKTNPFFGSHNYVLPESSSTGEILTELFRLWGTEVDADMAEALYTAIITDCGSFTFSCTTPQTMESAAFLMSKGIRVEKLRERIYENDSFIRKKLLGLILNNAELRDEGKFCLSLLSWEDFAALRPGNEDFENLVNHLIEIEGVSVACFARETKKNNWKLSFRGRGGSDVSLFAAEFGGGGHSAASGASAEGSLKELTEKLLNSYERIYQSV